MELFVSCADDFSTVGGPALFVIPVRSHPGTDNVVSPSKTKRVGPSPYWLKLGESLSVLPIYILL